MSDIELNAILYYADFLSLKACDHPVTDNCKYFFIHHLPINSLYLFDTWPIYDKENKYIQQAYQEYQLIKNKFGDEGLETFIDDICNIKACGTANAEQMLKCIHQYSSKRDRKAAFDAYNKWKKSRTYTHMTINDDGDPQRIECSQYVAHAEIAYGRQELSESVRLSFKRQEEQEQKI